MKACTSVATTRHTISLKPLGAKNCSRRRIEFALWPKLGITLALTTLLVFSSVPKVRLEAAESQPQFTKITISPIVTTLASPLGGAWGDCDKDGLIDLVVGAGF